MQVKIYATCNGLEKIYPGQRETSFNDIRTAEKNGGLGKKCYSIALNENGAQFSKFINVEDSHALRSGFMRILIELNYNEFNNGQNVYELLNCIHDLFKSEYIDDHNRVDIESFYNKIDLLENMIDGFSFSESPSRFGSSIIRQRSKKNAHFYYKSTEELIRIFDQSKQDEFLAFDTIYFISEDERAHDVNPLHQFINYDETTGTDLTNVVDLNNVEYQITGDNQLDSFIIKTNTHLGEINKHEGDFIRLNDVIKVIFSKRHYEDVIVEGKITDSSLSDYIKRDDLNRTIKIISNPNFVYKKLYSIKIKTKDSDDYNRTLNGINLILELNSVKSKQSSSNPAIFSFEGDEYEKIWQLKIDNTISINQYRFGNSSEQKDSIGIIPFQFKNQNSDEIELIKVKQIYFIFKSSSKNLKLGDINVGRGSDNIAFKKIDDKKVYFKFVGKQIGKKHRLDFVCEGFDNIILKDFDIEKYKNGQEIELPFQPLSENKPDPFEKITKYLAITAVSLLIITVSTLLYLNNKKEKHDKDILKKPDVIKQNDTASNADSIRNSFQNTSTDTALQDVDSSKLKDSIKTKQKHKNIQQVDTRSKTIYTSNEKSIEQNSIIDDKSKGANPSGSDTIMLFNNKVKAIKTKNEINNLEDFFKKIKNVELKSKMRKKFDKIKQDEDAFLNDKERTTYLLNK